MCKRNVETVGFTTASTQAKTTTVAKTTSPARTIGFTPTVTTTTTATTTASTTAAAAALITPATVKIGMTDAQLCDVGLYLVNFWYLVLCKF